MGLLLLFPCPCDDSVNSSQRSAAATCYWLHRDGQTRSSDQRYSVHPLFLKHDNIMFPEFLCGKQNFLKKGPLSHLKPVNVCLPACVWKNGRNLFLLKWSPCFANGKWYLFVGSAKFLIVLHAGELCWEADEDIWNWSFCGRVGVCVYEDICSLKQFVVLGHVDCCCWHWQTVLVEFLKSGGRQKTVPSPLTYVSFPMTSFTETLNFSENWVHGLDLFVGRSLPYFYALCTEIFHRWFLFFLKIYFYVL